MKRMAYYSIRIWKCIFSTESAKHLTAAPHRQDQDQDQDHPTTAATLMGHRRDATPDKEIRIHKCVYKFISSSI